MKKVAIYVRVSTLEQAEHGYSVDEQKDRLEKYAEIKDWSIYDVFVDGGFSGASLERPALQKMLQQVDEYNAVLVYKLDRLSRSQKDTLYLIEDVFNKNGVDFISLNENLDTSTAFGKAMIGILSVFAQLEREQMAERMAMGKVGRAKSGKAASWSGIMRPYGYVIENDIYQIVNYEAEIVKKIFDLYLSGSSIHTIAGDFSERMVDGKKWHHSTVRRILSNPIYIGKIRYMNEVYDGQHKGIISKEDFEETQIRIQERRIKHYESHNNTRPFQSKYVLSGLLRCGKCGSPLVISYAAKRADGTRNMYYKCRSRVKAYRNKRGIEKACGDEIYQKDALEETVYHEIKKLKMRDDLFVSSKSIERGMTTEEYTKEITALEKQKEKLTDLYLDNLIDKEEYLKRRKNFDDKKSYFESEIKTLEENKEKDDEKESITELIEYFSSNFDVITREKKKNIVNELVNSIVVDPNGMSIDWRFGITRN